MTKTLLDLTGVDLDDVEEVERRWNGWVADLFAAGLRPSEEPLPESTDTKLWYSVVRVDSVVSDAGRSLAGVA